MVIKGLVVVKSVTLDMVKFIMIINITNYFCKFISLDDENYRIFRKIKTVVIEDC